MKPDQHNSLGVHWVPRSLSTRTSVCSSSHLGRPLQCLPGPSCTISSTPAPIWGSCRLETWLTHNTCLKPTRHHRISGKSPKRITPTQFHLNTMNNLTSQSKVTLCNTHPHKLPCVWVRMTCCLITLSVSGPHTASHAQTPCRTFMFCHSEVWSSIAVDGRRQIKGLFGCAASPTALQTWELNKPYQTCASLAEPRPRGETTLPRADTSLWTSLPSAQRSSAPLNGTWIFGAPLPADRCSSRHTAQWQKVPAELMETLTRKQAQIKGRRTPELRRAARRCDHKQSG